MMKTLLGCAALVLLTSSLMVGQQYNFTVLHHFGSQAGDGVQPAGPLVKDKAGNLYGVTDGGGAHAGGTVFELSRTNGKWAETVLYNFCSAASCVDGQNPNGGLILDSAGNLYGTTINGGSGSQPYGTVFEVSPPAAGGEWTEKVLYSFCSVGICTDGAMPMSGVTMDAEGNLFGTTTQGGSSVNGIVIGTSGLVYELTPGSAGWTQTILYDFCPAQGAYCSDGTGPVGVVTFGPGGDLYGTTSLGGSQNSQGGGTVFRLKRETAGWRESVIFAFSNSGLLGYQPWGNISFDGEGNLYSVTVAGGAANNLGSGSVFELDAKGALSEFLFNQTDGRYPIGGVTLNPRTHTLFGTTTAGGGEDSAFYNDGVVFSISPTWQETVLHIFCIESCNIDGQYPDGPVILTSAGDLVGVTKFGGQYGNGVLFEMSPAQ